MSVSALFWVPQQHYLLPCPRSISDPFPIHCRANPRLLSLPHPNHTLTSPLPFTPFVHIFCRDPFDPFDLFDPFVHVFAMTLLTLLTLLSFLFPIFAMALWHLLLFRQTCSAISPAPNKGTINWSTNIHNMRRHEIGQLSPLGTHSNSQFAPLFVAIL